MNTQQDYHFIERRIQCIRCGRHLKPDDLSYCTSCADILRKKIRRMR